MNFCWGWGHKKMVGVGEGVYCKRVFKDGRESANFWLVEGGSSPPIPSVSKILLIAVKYDLFLALNEALDCRRRVSCYFTF